MKNDIIYLSRGQVKKAAGNTQTFQKGERSQHGESDSYILQRGIKDYCEHEKTAQG